MVKRRTSQILEISKIKLDKKLYPRTKENWMIVNDYKKSMQAGSKFPPIIVARYRDKYVLVDGWHRISARKQLKEKHIQSEILNGLTYNEIFVEAIKRNISHGYQLSPYEKRNIILRLENMKYNQLTISNIMSIPKGELRNFVGSKLTSTITGKQIILKRPIGHLAGFEVSDEIEKIQEDYAYGTQLQILNEVISLIRNGLIDLNNKKVEQKFYELKELMMGA